MPATDEVWRLQNRKDDDCKLFMKFAVQGHYGAGPKTKQGIYAVTPSGLLLGALNSNNPARVIAMLEGALKKWAQTPIKSRYLSSDPAKAKVPQRLAKYPADGLVLKVISRDLPTATRPRGWKGVAWNVQYAWFRQSEVRQWLPARIEKGALHDVPRALVERLVRFHLIDNVRGQTLSYKKSEIKQAVLATQVTRIRRGMIYLRLRGESETKSGSRGFKAKLFGTARYDTRKQRFVSFKLVAKGIRTGATRYNFRQGDLGPAPLGIAFVLGRDIPQEHVVPYFFHQYGWK